MATTLNKVLEHLHRVLSPPGGDMTDGQLLARFVAARDEVSFAALVRRHGPMVLGVCRRLLGHAQDAEDCFQATFFVLARKARTVRHDSVGSWLYAVAYRTSLEARAVNARRRARERQVEDMPHPEVQPPEAFDWRPWLDQELSGLPEKYRAVIVACDLEGQSRKEAARLLSLAEGTVSSRLARGRCLLAKRLSRYGFSLSSGALVAALSEGFAPAHLPELLVSSTVKAMATPLAAVSTSVAILTKGVLKSMFLTKLKWMVATVMIVTALGTGTGLVYLAAAPAAPPDKQADRKAQTELEALREENESLKLNLKVLLEKVRAQQAELSALRGDAGGVPRREREKAGQAAPESKPFETGWDKPVDPDNDCKFRREKGALTIEVPGKDHDLAIERMLMNSPRLLRDVRGDFVAEVRVGGKFQPGNVSTTNERVPFVGAGLILMADDNTYIRLERAALVKGGEVKTYANWELREDGKWVLAGEEAVKPLEDKDTYLRLERQGNKLLASVSQDGKEWHALDPLEVKLPEKLKVGVAAGTTSAEVFSPRYDRFKLTRKRDKKQAD